MANYGTILSECLQSPFNIESYRKFVVNFLNGTQLKAISGLRSADIFAEYSYYVQGYALVGEYTDPNRKRVGIYAVKLNAGRDIEKARSKQRNFIAKLLVDNNFDAAIAAFYLNEESKWRLSFVRLDYEFAKGKVSKNLTPAKRYSYLVGKDEPCHTAQESLLPIFAEENFMPSIDSIEQAFSIEKVTKQFFEKYKEKYLELKEYLEHTPCFVEEAKQRGFTSEQFAKKLMGQIVFLYFLQKKGWLGVSAINKEITERQYNTLYYYNLATRKFADKLYTKVADNLYKLNTAELRKLSQDEEECVAKALKGSPWGSGTRTFVRHIFNEANKKNENFFDAYLEPLFYEGLNKKRDADNYYAPLHCRIPFLNGGLFEPLDNYDWENNFFSIPNEMFSNADNKGVREADGILDIFDRYNFTMNEDEPLEKEVAVDPEMLGKIFENLLDVSDRKSKGAFYTPREIVHYMCQESLTNYIVNTIGTPYEDTKDFVVYGEIMKDEDCSRESTYGMTGLLMADSIYNNLAAIDKALADVRVADPAVGSGAFPMGMLSEIVKLREIITDYIAREMFLEYKAAGKMNVYSFEKQKLYNETRNPYILKKDAMRNSIYAVDIEPSAVDIAKLRLWLSLVVEQEIDPNDPNNNKPVALPNLDCNIMCGNSLIDEFEGIDLSFDDIICNDTSQTSIFGNSVDNDLQILFKLQRDYFYADNHDEKFKLKQEIAEVKDRILSLAFTSASEEKKRRFEVANTLHSTPFFLWKLNFAKVFKEKGGFDIVIGNPPYVGEKGNKELFRPIAVTKFGSKTYMGKMDLFYFFFHKGIDLGNDIAEVSFITTNYYITAAGGKTLREDFKHRTQVRSLINFNELKIFESALGQHNMITILTKNMSTPVISHNYLCNATGIATSSDLRFLLTFSDELRLNQYSVEQKFLYDGAESYLRLAGINNAEDKFSSILSKIATGNKLLKDIATIKQGIVSGADKYTDAHQIKYSLNFQKNKGIFVLSQKELDELNLTEAEKKYVKPVYKNSAISKYSIEYSDNLYVLYVTKEARLLDIPNIINHLQQFKPILQAKRETVEGKLPWYSLHWARDPYVFEHGEKIVNSRRAKENIFALETKKHYEQSDIMITAITAPFMKEYPPKYVLGLLNSSLYRVWLKNRGKLKGELFELYGAPLEEIPIKKADLAVVNSIIERVDKMLNAPSSETQNELNEIIYKLYGLTDEEIAIVEETFQVR